MQRADYEPRALRALPEAAALTGEQLSTGSQGQDSLFLAAGAQPGKEVRIMPMYTVEVTRSITATVEVEAESPSGAADRVNARDFPLPPRDEWEGSKDWEYTVYGKTGLELYRTG